MTEAMANLGRVWGARLHSTAGRRWGLVILPRLVAAVALVAVAAALARLTWSWIEGAPVAGMETSAGHASALARGGGVRLETLRLFGEVARKAPVSALKPASRPAAHNLQLSGIYLESGPDGVGYAVLAPPNVIPLVYAVGDTVKPGIMLESIHPDHVVLNNRGHAETLRLPDGTDSLGIETAASSPPPVSTDAGDVVVVDKATRRKLERYRQQLLGNPLAVAGVIRGQPVMRNGQVVGVRLSNGRDPALMAQLGLRANDLLMKVNDIPVGDASRIGELLELISEARRFELQLERNNAHELLTIYLDG